MSSTSNPQDDAAGKKCGYALKRSIAIGFACLLLVGSQVIAASHIDDCHDHPCSTCGIPVELCVFDFDLDTPRPALLAHGTALLPLPRTGAHPLYSHLIRAPPAL